MEPEDYQFLCRILAEGSGLALGPGKEYLIESRLGPIAATLGASDIPGLVQKLRVSRDPGAERTVCEAMTTNESLFFRDGAPFEFLKERVFPELATARRARRRLRMWSAAASTGQEAYSIAMSLAIDAPMLGGYQVEILGTDLSRAAVERARRGVFTPFEVQRGLPAAMLAKCFTQVRDGWQVNEDIRRHVAFREMNLLHDFSSLGAFDVIFCRNVLIYFDATTKARVLARLGRVLAPDGYLFLGSAEAFMAPSEDFVRLESDRTSVYRPR